MTFSIRSFVNICRNPHPRSSPVLKGIIRVPGSLCEMLTLPLREQIPFFHSSYFDNGASGSLAADEQTDALAEVSCAVEI